MKAIIQTVKNASCTVEGELISAMDEGLLVYYGVDVCDKMEDILPFFQKIIKLRIYRGEDDRRMNYSILDRSREIMLISQFTLMADLSSGNRPSLSKAMGGEEAEVFYNKAIEILTREGINVKRGVFGAHMMINYTNDGPETFIYEK